MAPETEEPISLEDASRIRTFIVKMITGELSRGYVKNAIMLLFNRDLDTDLKSTEELLRVMYEKENSNKPFKTATLVTQELKEVFNNAKQDRPVTCWFCGEKMYYAGDTKHEPEIKVAFEGYIENPKGFDNEFFIHNKYVHSKCFVELVDLLNTISAKKQMVNKKAKGLRMLRPEEVKI